VTPAARTLISGALLGATVLTAPGGRAGVDAAPSPPLGDELSTALDDSDTGTLRVIVTMATAVAPEAQLSTAAVDVQHQAIEASLDTLGTTLAGTSSRVVHELQSVPTALVEVDRAGLDALLADPAVESVVPDHQLHLLLESSTAVIESGRLNHAGVTGISNRTGRPYEVAVIDSGVARRHNALAGKVVAEACFSIGRACPNGRDSQFGPGSAPPCTFARTCGHGTHVAGIAAGRAFRGGHEGVAPRARIVAIRVGQRAVGGGWVISAFDLDRALQRVLNLRRAGRPIASVNLSVGFRAFRTVRSCRAAQPSTEGLAAQLRSARVAVVAAAGNEGRRGAIAFPACLASVFAVSASDDADRVPRFTNVSRLTDWFAPGVSIDAPWPGGPNTQRRLLGTSMASPHVAGAFALLRECVGNTTPAAVAADLSATGRRIRASGITRRRINVMQAATRNVRNDDFASARRMPSRGRVNLASWNICAGREPGEPGPGRVNNSIWFWWRPARSGRAVISTENGAGHRTNFNTELAVFTGGRLNALHAVAYDNNSGTGLRSRVVIRVRAGTTYRVRVDGFGARYGRFNLHAHVR
jgi:subtilisin family serine protease